MALTCDICAGATVRVLDFGLMPLANGYTEPERRELLNVERCDACNFYQLGARIAPFALFANYKYRAGATAQQAVWEELADIIAREVGYTHAFTVVDVGGNDGALLATLGTTHRAITRINVEPYAPPQLDPEVGVAPKEWNQQTAVLVREAYGNARVITMTNVLAHIPDPHESIGAIAALLNPIDGVALIQAPWHYDLFRHNLFDTIYHEHVYYWGVRAMQRLVEQHGMVLARVDYLPAVHGGSLRYWIRPQGNPVDASVQRVRTIEDDAVGRFSASSSFALWRAAAQAQLPPTFWLIGAAAKATMFLAMTNTAGRVTRIFDSTQAKWGLTLPGTTRYIEPQAALAPPWPDAVFVGAWNHAPAIRTALRIAGYHGLVLTPESLVLP